MARSPRRAGSREGSLAASLAEKPRLEWTTRGVEAAERCCSAMSRLDEDGRTDGRTEKRVGGEERRERLDAATAGDGR